MIYRAFLLIVLFTLTLSARLELYPAKSCALYDNLKHTKNTHQLQLDMTHTYEMLEHHKGQYLVKVEGENPGARWVDDACLRLRPLKGTPLYGAKKKQEVVKEPQETRKHTTSEANLLALSWQNAFCETHRKKKECKPSLRDFFKKGNFTLHGLWPQPRDRVYCGVERGLITADRYGHWNRLPEPKITPELKQRLTKVMPGVVSNLHRHEWIKHGTCYGTSAQHYFEDAVSLTEEIRASQLARFFQKNTGKRVSIDGVKRAFEATFGKGSANALEMRCKNGLITEIWLHLQGKGNTLQPLLKPTQKHQSRCRYGIVDKVGFGK